MEEIKEINEDIIRLKEAMNMIRERENSIKEQNEALEDETRIVKAQREEQKLAKAEEDLKEFKDQTLEIILRMANKVKEIRKTAQMQYIKDSVNAVRAVQERKNLQSKRIKLLNKKNAELNNDKLTETERARKEKFIEAISIKIENEQKEIDGLPNVKKVEENWKKTSDDLNNAEETLNKYRLILLGIRVQTQNEYEQDEPTPNRPVQGEPMPNRPVPGESTPSEPVQDEQEQDEPTPSEPAQDEQEQGEPTPSRPVQGESTPSEPVQDEQEQDEPAPGEPTPSRPVQGEPTPDEPVQDEQAQDEPALGEPTPSEPIQGEQEQGEPTPDEPVQDEQAQDEPTPSEPAQDEPIEQPELIDKAIIRATEEARRKYMDLIRRAQIGNSRNKQYEKDINLAESRGDHTLAKKIDEERKKFLESYPKEPEIKRAEENLRRNEIKSAIICGVYDEGVKDVIRRGIVLSNKDEVLAERADLEKEALRMLTEEERNDIMGTCNRKGYIGGVNIDLKNNEVSVLVDGLELKTSPYERSDYSPIKRWIEKKEILSICDRFFGVKIKGRESRNLDEKVFDALGWLGSKDPNNPSEEDIPVYTEYFTAYHKSLTDNPDRPRIAIAYNGEKINEKSFNASKKYMRQAQKFGGTIPEGCDVRTPWQKFIDFLKKPKMIEEGDGKGESEQQGEQTDEKTPQGGQAAKDFRDRNHDEKAAATVEETAQQNAQEAQRNAQKAQGTQNRDAEKGK